MAQPSASREPTMEEILASIRRIIESNDGQTPEEAAPADDDAHDLDLSSSEDTGSAPVATAGTIDSVSDRAPLVSAGGEVQAPRPVSLAEVAARVRASGTARQATMRAGPLQPAAMHGNAAVRVDPQLDCPVDEEPETVDDPDPDAEPAVQIAANDRGSALAAESVVPLRDVADVDEAAAVEASLDDALSAAVDAEVRADFGKAAMESTWQDADTAVEDRPDTAGTHLLSASAGARVAASFGDLSDVFSAGPRRSFDEMAEEMLRPMLQQWLDDNLPTLVERLVREEIERVARGPRR